MQPKISAVLNNCALHLFTPEIKAEIEKFAANKSYNNNHNDQYDVLKNIFAKFYGFSPEEFTYAQFSNILENYNLHDCQLLLGPVLRQYIKTTMTKEDIVELFAISIDVSPQEYIKLKTEIDASTGRYDSLSPDEIAVFIGNPLGISLTYHSQHGSPQSLPAEYSISSIDIFHQGGITGAEAGGHWERENNSENIIDFSKQKDTQLTFISSLFSEGSADMSQCGILLLKKHIELTKNNPKNLNELVLKLNDQAKALSDHLMEGEFPDINKFAEVLKNIKSEPIQTQLETQSEYPIRFKQVDDSHTNYNFLFQTSTKMLTLLKDSGLAVAYLTICSCSPIPNGNLSNSRLYKEKLDQMKSEDCTLPTLIMRS
ncbi:hypothetical protein Ltuc_0563 [Legionella tucsonensis]|uniref:Uncharacterized protein n=2 Tax=Legionella tucsonensis TaxID=40335 RepID=A0A0W0ZU69_9GAMM|nr:hypothetical protein Ltuc_0563 [Legionella tucsonensis]